MSPPGRPGVETWRDEPAPSSTHPPERLAREPDGFSSAATPPRQVCVVVHDVAPPTQAACQRLIDAIDDVAPVPLTLLAVPRYHGAPRSAAFERWLRARQAAGDEVALHGHTHVDDGEPRDALDRLRRRHYTRGEGEFIDLAPAEAARRLDAGMRWFEELGLPLHGFVAPAWLLGPGAWQALDARRFEYTCTVGSLVLLPDRRAVAAQSLVYSTSSGWRRACSRAWVAAQALRQAPRPLLRLELHPPDAAHAAVRRSWQRVLERALESRAAVTLAQAARAHRGVGVGDAGMRKRAAEIMS